MDVNLLLFPDFETLDAFGPVEIFGKVETFRLRYFSLDGGVVASRQGTRILTEARAEIDPTGILLLPGGQGTRPLSTDAAFLAALGELAAQSAYCLSVCTGSALLARCGALAGRRATTNKKSFDWVVSLGGGALWQRQARWCVDGKFYTSSGVSAGTDMALGFVADRCGGDKAKEIARHIEYRWNADPADDPFAAADAASR